MAMAKRSYGAVSVAPLGDGFTVTLDGRTVRTPAGRAFPYDPDPSPAFCGKPAIFL